MTIPVTKRSDIAAPLSFSQMDTNLTNLARDASTTVQGNIRLATQGEVDAFAATNLAVSPATLNPAVVAIHNFLTAGEPITTASLGATFKTSGWWRDGRTTLTIQWGAFVSTSDSAQNFNFPIPFSVPAFAVFLTTTDANEGSGGGVTATTTTSFTYDRSSSIDHNHDMVFFAIGKS